MGSRGNIDRLSNMPEEVISHILSLMPTKVAVRTSILSKSWIHTWKSITNLDFNNRLPFRDVHRFTKFVDQVLERCKASQVKLFRLRCLDFWFDKSSVCKWIDAAVRLNVCELDVKWWPLVLPHSLFTCKTLTKLSLHDFGSHCDFASYVNLPCLKAIHIAVADKVSVNMLNLIHGCPVLESLSLKIYQPSNQDYNFNIPTLKHMKLSIRTLTDKFDLNVPKLTDISTVFVMEFIEDVSSYISVTLSNYNGSSLISVTLSYDFGSDPFWVEVLKGVIGAKSLTLDVPQSCYIPGPTPVPDFPYLKHLEFNARSSRYYLNWLLFHQILENSPELEHISIITNPKDQKDSYWNEPQSVPTCMLKNLRTVKFANFKGQKSYLQFLAYLLGNAEILAMLTVTSDSLSLEEEMQLSAEVLQLPRASRYCEIHFLGSRSHSTTS